MQWHRISRQLLTGLKNQKQGRPYSYFTESRQNLKVTSENIISRVFPGSPGWWRRSGRMLLILMAFLILHSICVFGQSTGDYRSVGSTGTWSQRTRWERYDGDSWEQPTGAQGYPGQNGIPVRVFIYTNITLDVTPITIRSLYVNAGSYLDLSGARFTVNEQTEISGSLYDFGSSGTVTFGGTVKMRIPEAGFRGQPEPKDCYYTGILLITVILLRLIVQGLLPI